MTFIEKSRERISDLISDIDWFWWLLIIPGAIFIIYKVGIVEVLKGSALGVLATLFYALIGVLAIILAGRILKILPKSDRLKKVSPFDFVCLGLIIFLLITTFFI